MMPPRLYAPIVISVLVILTFDMVLGILLLRPITITDALKDLLLVLIGMLAAKFGDVVVYWVGSSASSQRKDEVIANRPPAQPPGAQP